MFHERLGKSEYVHIYICIYSIWIVDGMWILWIFMNHTLPNCLPNIQLRTLRRTWCGNLSRHGHKTPFTPSKRLVKTLGQNLVFRFGFGSSAKTQAVQERWKVQLEVARMSEDFKFTAFWSYDRVGSFWAAPCSTSHRINDFVYDKSNLRELEAMLQDASGTTALWRAVHGGHVQPV